MAKETTPIGNRIIYLLIGLTGLFLIYSSIITTTRTTWLRWSGRETTGKVTEVKEVWLNTVVQQQVKVDNTIVTPERQESRRFFRAIISVKTDEGTAELLSNRVEEKPAYQIGEELPVLYFPGYLAEGQVVDEMSGPWTGLCLGLVGLLMFGATIGWPLVRRFFT